jgi:FkbM family methyltransferase
VIQHNGIWFPDDVGTKYLHSFKHVRSLEPTLTLCAQHRTAVQAGGNIGLWPKRMADVFDRVLTFEPEPISRACLTRNVPRNVTVSGLALGDRVTECGIERKSLGSHQVVTGDDVVVVPIDSFELKDVDLIQLDIEGFEWHALMGAALTIQRCHPVIHLELRGFTEQYGQTDAAVRSLLESWGYLEHSTAPGNDVVFTWRVH